MYLGQNWMCMFGKVEMKKKREKKYCSLKIQQLPKEIVHLRISQCSLHFHVLHHFQTDCLERSQSQQELGEPLGRYWVHGLSARLQTLQDLLLKDLHLLLGGRTQSFGIY